MSAVMPRVTLDEGGARHPDREARTVEIVAGRWRFRLRVRAAAVPPTPEEAVMIADAVVAALTAGLVEGGDGA